MDRKIKPLLNLFLTCTTLWLLLLTIPNGYPYGCCLIKGQGCSETIDAEQCKSWAKGDQAEGYKFIAGSCGDPVCENNTDPYIDFKCEELSKTVPYKLTDRKELSIGCYESTADPGLDKEKERFKRKIMSEFCPKGLCNNGSCPNDKKCKLKTTAITSNPNIAINDGDGDNTGCKNGSRYYMEVDITPPEGTITCPCACGGNLVTLFNFTAKPTSKGVSLNWTTKTEPDSQGFKMWRAIPKLDSYCGCSGNIEDYTQIQVLDEEGKPVLIPAKGSTTSGSDYSYLDKDAKLSIAYCYALEDIDFKGKSTFYFEYVAFTQNNLEETK